MLKDSKGRWLKKVTISEDLWKESIQVTHAGVIRKLQATRAFLDDPGFEDFCAGLYTVAVEEYGKLLVLLNSTKSANGERIIKYKKQFMNHNYKFSLAIKELPEECFIIQPGTYSRRSFSRKSFNVAILADLETRLTVFYTDFNSPPTVLVKPPPVDKRSLTSAIDAIETFVKNKTLLWK